MKTEPPLVCDTSVVSNLGRRGGLSRLTEHLSNERRLIVPHEVESELFLDDSDFYSSFLSKHFEVIRSPLVKLSAVLQAAGPVALDAGESAVLALCLEWGWQPCIDETLGRTVSRTLGFRPTGTIALLQRACSLSWMTDDECLEVMASLKARGFYCPRVQPNDTFADYVSRLKNK